MLGGISIWQLLIILLIVVMIFGTKKLRNAGGDLGSAIKNFKKNVKDGEAEVKADAEANQPGKLHSEASEKPDADFEAKAATGGVDPTVDSTAKTNSNKSA